MPIDAPILALALALAFYYAWEAIPHRAQSRVLLWFWIAVIGIGALGIAYALLTSGSLPEPALAE